MGILDKLLGRSGELKEKAAEHSDSIGRGLDKAGEAANRATKGRFEGQIDKATGKAKDGIDTLGEQRGRDAEGPGGDGPAGRGGQPG